MSKNLAYVKMVTGDYVIGEVTHDDETSLTLKKPVSIIFDPMQGGLGFMPYDAMYVMKELEEINIKKDFIIHEFKGDLIPKELEDKYTEFCSGIITTPEQAAGANNSNTQIDLDQLNALAQAMQANN